MPRFLDADVCEKDDQCGEERPIVGVEFQVETLIDRTYVDDPEDIEP